MQTLKEKADILLKILTDEAIALNPNECNHFLEIAMEFYCENGSSIPIELGEKYQKIISTSKYNAN